MTKRYWIVLAVFAFALILWTSRSLGMWGASLSPRYSLYAIPAVVSDLRGKRHDYTAYKEIADVFWSGGGNISHQIKSSLAIPITHPDDLWFVSGDDKGLIDLVYAGFAVFGKRAESIHAMVLLLFALSIIAYAAQFLREPGKMALLMAVISGFYCILFTFGLTDQSTSFIEPRFIGFLSIIALTHLALIMVRDSFSWPLALAQVVLLLFVVHVRSSEIWQLLFLGFVWIASRQWRRIAIPVVLAIFLLGCTLYKHVVFHPHYFESDIQTRVLWHNALMGLAADPTLREQYQLTVLDDKPVVAAVSRYLERSGKPDITKAPYSDPEYAKTNFKGFNWALYEPAARDTYLDIVRNHPWSAINAYLVEMPKILIANIGYMIGAPVFDWPAYLAGNVATVGQRHSWGLYLRPTLPVILLLFACVLLLYREPVSFREAGLLAGMVVFSLIPPFLAMPVFQYVQLSVMLGISLLFLSLLATLQMAVARAARTGKLRAH